MLFVGDQQWRSCWRGRQQQRAMLFVSRQQRQKEHWQRREFLAEILLLPTKKIGAFFYPPLINSPKCVWSF